MTAAVWLRHCFYVRAADVVVGDCTPWGEVVDLRRNHGDVNVVTRTADGGEDVQQLDRDKHIPLQRMVDPIERGAPSWCCPPSVCR